MSGRCLVLICLIVASAREAAAQVEVVGPSFAALSVPDLNASVRWYRTAFGLSVVFEGGSPDSATKVGAPKIGFFVRDMDSAVAVLRRQGAAIEGTWLVRPSHISPDDSLWTRNILVRDNSGTYVQLFERQR
jgi:hypothetical protein